MAEHAVSAMSTLLSQQEALHSMRQEAHARGLHDLDPLIETSLSRIERLLVEHLAATE